MKHTGLLLPPCLSLPAYAGGALEFGIANQHPAMLAAQMKFASTRNRGYNNYRRFYRRAQSRSQP